MTDTSYNGWSSYETWAAYCWLSGYEPTQRYWEDRARHWAAEPSTSPYWSQSESARFNLADEMQAAIEGQGDEMAEHMTSATNSDTAGLYVDLLRSALHDVSWHELAGAYLDGVALDMTSVETERERRPYSVDITGREMESLAWAAGRYHSADVLYRALEPADDDGDVYTLAEHEAWDYREALEAEDGAPIVPPCLAGDLADKLAALWGSIV